MSANDFYFAVNAMFRHLHDRYGRDVLIDYCAPIGAGILPPACGQVAGRGAGGDRRRLAGLLRTRGWRSPSRSTAQPDGAVELDVQVCPAIKHMRDHGRDIVPYFCEHCDHVCSAMAEEAGFTFERRRGNGRLPPALRAGDGGPETCRPWRRTPRGPGDALMLGSQDFCGYYDWTFAYVQHRMGQPAVEQLWADAIGGESQAHYLEAAKADGLRGLYRTWAKTGEEEHCDWTWHLDEQRNVLRWDMRQCPSKGFLLQHDLNACTDYCDHCMGWIIPLLAGTGVEVVAHEHNHMGQCWAELAVIGKPHQPADVKHDIRHDPSWRYGFVERWSADGGKLPILEQVSRATDPSQVLRDWFARYPQLLVWDGAGEPPTPAGASAGVLTTDAVYNASSQAMPSIAAVLISHTPADLKTTANRFCATEAGRRPLLMYSYPPAQAPIDFAAFGLPRPVPILPLLIEHGVYRHAPGEPPPSPATLLRSLAATLAT